FETMRDATGDAVAVCSMENVDPVGVHTGDSIVVAPALTLSEHDYEMLRQASLKIVSALGIIGGCNCQYALDPHSSQYAVIEVNPRVSRSSALASKATGYPIAKVTTKLALGYTLGEIKNEKTGKSCAGFEPQVNYIVCKFPKWPFDKFVGASRKLGTQMKATGEVMSIAPTFEMALMKAVRGAEIGLDTLQAAPVDGRDVLDRLGDCDDRRIFTVYEALKSGVSVDKVHEITRITPYFLEKIKGLVDFEAEIAKNGLGDNYARGKELGYTDAALERISGHKCTHVPCVYKTVDTCAEEFSVETPYFYARRGDNCEAKAAVSHDKKRILVLGSGPIRIGQGIEFDYSSVHCVWTLQNLGYEVAIINNNPETVSTDYDTADRLYFEPLCPEDVMDVIGVEQPEGVVVAFGGQTAIKLTQFLDKQGITILGTSAEGIDLAEDRERFDGLLESVGIRRPKGMGVKTLEQALSAANTLEYPVLLRPSYVIGGQNMTIAHSDNDVRTYMERILAQKIENPVLVDKYMMGTELEVDVISDGETVLIPGIMEHIERAGVHSGDSIAVYPPYSITDKMTRTVIDCSQKLALALGTKGLVNIQYLIYHGELYVIEVNPRASRTIPYISKVTGVPMVDLAARVMTGEKLSELGYGSGLYKTPPYYAVKVPVFSFEKLNDVNSYLGPEMKSTGEVLGVGKNLTEALFKGLTAAGIKLRSPKRGGASGVFLSVDEHDHPEIVK
ncbi:MAG: carbamoyl-phosphate synthase large subunit, partial [Clostridia bacterium]|nr:carbamoyl-phosphate synthase large subunit [Clostridia bacterium]